MVVLTSLWLSACQPDTSSDGQVDAYWLAQRTRACAACHGRQGVAKTSAFPTLAGQPASYLRHALTAYRDGGRDNAIMAAQARGLTDAQIRALAGFYHRQATPLDRRPGPAPD